MSVAIDVDSFPAKPGLFLSGGRWRILQKLGAGPRSSTWLAVNSEDSNNIAALKILTVRATTTSAELRLLKKIKRAKLYQLPVLRSSFVETSPHGQHLCLLLDLLGPSVEDFREGQPLSVHIVKKIVADVLEALCALHDKGIIHGAVSSDNLLFAVLQYNLLLLALQLAMMMHHIQSNPLLAGPNPEPVLRMHLFT